MIQPPAPLAPMPPRRRTSGRSLVAAPAFWAGIVTVAFLMLAVPVIMTLTSAPAPATQTAGASAAPTATAGDKTRPDWAPGMRGWAGGLGNRFRAGPGRGPITITAISGSSLSLATQDGWTRTITVTADTKISRGGQAIAIGALKVNDVITFSEKRNTDGTYTITAIVVPTPATGGDVTAVTGSTITVKKRDGSTRDITVTSSTVYTLGGAAGSKADVKVGVSLTAEGTVDGLTFTALSVHIALAHAGGAVTATTSTSLTIKDRSGATTVIHVSSSTTFRIRGKNTATVSDIAVGDNVKVDGTRNTDGSIDAVTVSGGPMGNHGGWPKPTPTLSTPSS